MKYDFSYLIEKIRESEFLSIPFKHLYIERFFSDSHFSELLNTPEVDIASAASDQELLKDLERKGWNVIKFPGCTTDIEKYIRWHESRNAEVHHSATEGFGLALRLYTPKSQILRELNTFLSDQEFVMAVAKKFDVNPDDCRYDAGIQKYLDGYEISPHADVRRKAATYMVNINPSVESEMTDHHTHYLEFSEKRRYIEVFWEGNAHVDRCWVPWEWTKTVFQQTKNNSIVLFSPSNDTLHGVKASYNHLHAQRTQLYGNLWYENVHTSYDLEWEALDLHSNLVECPNLPSFSKKSEVKNKVGLRNI